MASPNYRSQGSEAEQCPHKLNLLIILLGALVQTIKKKKIPLKVKSLEWKEAGKLACGQRR